jgi:hypothetical protein
MLWKVLACILAATALYLHLAREAERKEHNEFIDMIHEQLKEPEPQPKRKQTLREQFRIDV